MSELLTGIVMVLLGAFVIDAIVRSRRRALRQSGLLPPEGTGSDADVARLARQGEHVEAIRLYREIHGGGLKEAKEAVDRLGAGSGSGLGPSVAERLSDRLEAVGADEDVERLVEGGRTIEAVKRYREIHGVGLAEAKSAIDAVEDALRRAGRMRPS